MAGIKGDYDPKSKREYQFIEFPLSHNHYYKDGKDYTCAKCNTVAKDVSCSQITCGLEVCKPDHSPNYYVYEEKYTTDCINPECKALIEIDAAVLHQYETEFMAMDFQVVNTQPTLKGKTTDNLIRLTGMPFRVYKPSVVYGIDFETYSRLHLHGPGGLYD
jgi:hypothetical protein